MNRSEHCSGSECIPGTDPCYACLELERNELKEQLKARHELVSMRLMLEAYWSSAGEGQPKTLSFVLRDNRAEGKDWTAGPAVVDFELTREQVIELIMDNHLRVDDLLVHISGKRIVEQPIVFRDCPYFQS